MRMGNRRPGRSLLALAGLMTVAAACAACGGGPAKVSLRDASANPCLLVSQAQARAILGPGISKPKLAPELGSGCDYASGTRLVNLGIDLGTASLGYFSILMTDPRPVPSVGHRARCGPVRTNPAQFDLFAAISHDHKFVIVGPSCATDAAFARQAYSHL
jgi:hypothetical protein